MEGQTRSNYPETLPAAWYHDPAIFQRERQAIFRRHWWPLAREDQLASLGAYAAGEIAGWPAFVIRGKDGALRGFHNVCRHRGHKLASGSGNKKLLVCPYHQWSYDLSGQLKVAPNSENVAGFDQSVICLTRIRVENFLGFVFINLDPDCDSMDETYPGIRQEMLKLCADLEQRKHAFQHFADEGCNWLTAVENYNECYHCAGVHPELCQVVPVFRKGGGKGLDWEGGIPQREGTNTFTFSGTTNRAPFPDLDDDEKVRHKGELLYPNLMLSLAMDHVAAFTLWPRSPLRTDIICEFLFHPDEMQGPDFDPMDAVEFWDLTNKQDWKICESVQRGMRSRVFESGYYAPMEDLSLDIREYVRERLADE